MQLFDYFKDFLRFFGDLQKADRHDDDRDHERGGQRQQDSALDEGGLSQDLPVAFCFFRQLFIGQDGGLRQLFFGKGAFFL